VPSWITNTDLLFSENECTKVHTMWSVMP